METMHRDSRIAAIEGNQKVVRRIERRRGETASMISYGLLEGAVLMETAIA